MGLLGKQRLVHWRRAVELSRCRGLSGAAGYFAMYVHNTKVCSDTVREQQ